MDDLAYLALIWVGVFAASLLSHRTRLTPVLWYLFFGCVFVNMGWLPQHMTGFIEGFAEVGIILIMFALGFEEDTSKFVRSIKRSWGIAFFGALVPFCIAYSVINCFWSDANMAMLGGLAMTATAVSLTMVSLKTEGLHRTAAATGIMTSAVLDDIASLALVAIMVPIATGQTEMNIGGIVLVLGKTLLFFVFIVMLGWLLSADASPLRKLPLLGRFNLRHLLAMADGEQATLGILIIAILVSLIAHYFGFHPAVGAYMAGLILKEEYFVFHQEKGVNYHKNSHTIIDNVAFSWIGPVFFVVLGTRLIFDINIFISVLPQTILLTLGLFIGQILSAGLAARFTGGFDWPSSWMIGFGMLGRAELAFVVMDIAYVQHHIFTDEVFYTLMFTAFWLNVAVPLSIRWWKFKYDEAGTERGN
jgi:Na+:H+ antiporter